MKKEYDGMRYPSIGDLLEKIDSKYKLAYASAKRAKIIEEKDMLRLRFYVKSLLVKL